MIAVVNLAGTSPRVTDASPVATSQPQQGSVPLGLQAQVGTEWRISVRDVDLDATARVLAADPSNPAPASGHRYVIVKVRTTVGDNSSGSVDYALATDDGVDYERDTTVMIETPAVTVNMPGVADDSLVFDVADADLDSLRLKVAAVQGDGRHAGAWFDIR